MRKDCLLSVIIPVFNTENYLRQCVNSVCGQKVSDIEVILIDDGSSDRSREICDELSVRDKRVTVIHQENMGVSCARNAGLRVAKGKFVTFVDSDDWVEPEGFDHLISDIERKHADVCYCISRYDGNDRITYYNGEKTALSNVEALKELARGNFISSVDTALYRREAISGIYFDKSITYWEDFCFQIDVLMHCNRVAINKDAYYHVVKRRDSATSVKVNRRNTTCLKIPDRIIGNRVADKIPWIAPTIRYKMLADFLVAIMKKGIDYEDRKKVINEASKTARICVREFKNTRYTTWKGQCSIFIVSVIPKGLLGIGSDLFSSMMKRQKYMR